ncbi:SDR family NAD(P)-dependent oxidoreductase [Agarilytica rhodophyticola]|uniref:SDR family NAD(P)-dependent oxidoreductase n=1 Tax=Agarilytica rhodophyticola TaxID=1737490 RepID=UPI001C1FCEF2|nr:SDR family NAD(P)-dependent oxidoreductase [Agarilytica rhodophyticola]
MKINIKDKVALVTGANRGIGLAIVESFIAHGAQKVYLAVRNKSTTAELVEKYGEKVMPVQVDVSDEASVKQLATQAKDVDVVVNNAGTLEVADPLDKG